MKFRKAVFILITFVTLASIHLFIYTQNINIKYRITDLKVKLQELRSKNRERESQVAQKENLPNIERIAKEKLDMIYPERINYLFITKEASP